MSLAHWIGARAADVVSFFRDKPFVPCQVDWENQLPDSFFDSIEEFIDTDEFYAPLSPDHPSVGSVVNIRGSDYVLEVDGVRSLDDDCCPDYEVDCCLTTDTIGEFEGKA